MTRLLLLSTYVYFSEINLHVEIFHFLANALMKLHGREIPAQSQ